MELICLMELKEYYNSTVIRAGKDICFQNGWD